LIEALQFFFWFMVAIVGIPGLFIVFLIESKNP